LGNYRGLYSADVKFTEAERSRVFVKVTKTKTLAAYGQIVDVLFGNNTFPLTVNPTKLPEGVADTVSFETDDMGKKITEESIEDADDDQIYYTKNLLHRVLVILNDLM
jgi:hypothetical protein